LGIALECFAFGLKLILGVEFYCGVEKCLIWIPLLGMLEEWFGLEM
jgi:hypothetical protein